MPGQADLDRARAWAGRRFLEAEKRFSRQTAERYRQAWQSIRAQFNDLWSRSGGTLAEAKKYSRLGSMLSQIAGEYRRLTGQTVGRLETHLAAAYRDSVLGNRWAIESGAGVRVSWGVVPTAAVEAAVFNEQSGALFSKRLRDNATTTIRRLGEQITRSLATGDNWERAAAALSDQFLGGLSDALRVIRTESMRAYNTGHLDAVQTARERGIEIVKYWLAAEDDRTRPDHAEMDDQEADEDGVFTLPDGSRMLAPLVPDPSGPAVPAGQIVNCRCVLGTRLAGRVGQTPAQEFAAWLETQP